MLRSTEYCKNCNHHLLLNQKFCHNCGQKSATHRINFHFFIHEIQHGIFHVDSGILYTLKCLFTHPGHSIRDYLEGKRQSHFKPVMMVVFLGGLCGLVQHFIDKDKKDKSDFLEVNDVTNPSSNFKDVDFKGLIQFMQQVFNWFSEHFAFTVLVFLPVAALAFFLGFKKYKYNYFEWLVFMCFSVGQALAVYFVFLVLGALFSTSFFGWAMLVAWCLSFWTLYQFVNHKFWFGTLVRTLFSDFLYLIFSAIAISLFSISVFLIGYYMYSK